MLGKIKLIAMDLDGTTLQKDHESFSPRLLHALDEAEREGIHILPVTGRPWEMRPKVLQNRYPWSERIVCANGAEERDLRDGTVLRQYAIDAATVERLIQSARDIGALEIHQNGHQYISAGDYQKEAAAHPGPWYHGDRVLKDFGIIVQDLEEQIRKDPARIVKASWFCFDDNSCRRAREILAQLPVSAAETAPGGFEIGCPEANKYLGIQRVCRELGLDPAEAAYLGDSENDRSVFGRLGISVAMGNAPQGLKKIADLVADNYDDDGAAKAIEQLMKQ